MPYKNKTDTQYKNDYAKENYDRIPVVVPRGQKEEIKKRAQNMGESVNLFIYKSLVERIARIESEQNRD